MDLIYQDRNLIVTYIQIYLRENFGLTVRKVKSVGNVPEHYEVTGSDEIVVTGYLTPQTYSSIALYMAQYYPNEMYPCRWKDDYKDYTEDTVDADGNVLLLQSTILDIISYNLSEFNDHGYTDAITVPERVVTYLMGEVVSQLSSQDEIMRVKRTVADSSYVVSEINNDDYLSYSQSFMNVIKRIQQSYLDSHKNNLPPQFKGFRVTGYVDPWTEVILQRGDSL